MKLRSVMVFRFVCVFIFILASVIALLLGFVIPFVHHKVTHIERSVKLNSDTLHAESISQVENTAKRLQILNSTALNLANVLSSSFNGTELPFPNIKTKVAHKLFQALSVLPHLSQISYIGSDGRFFAYYLDHNQTFAVYSNTSFLSNSSTTQKVTANYTWYTQLARPDTGKLYGDAIKSDLIGTYNSTWFWGALNYNNGYASLAHGWNSDDELVFLNTASIATDINKGVVSLGFSGKWLSKHFLDNSFYGGKLYLSTKEGTLILQGIPNTRMVMIDDDSVSIKLLTPSGYLVDHAGNISCKPNEDGTIKSTFVDVLDTKYLVYCSQIDILGVQSVYLLAFPNNELVNLVHQISMWASVVLIVGSITMVLIVILFLILMIRATRREMHLCSALIKQMEATQQAERKHLNKRNAFNNANHDIRSSLLCIIALTEYSFRYASHGSELETNLRQMQNSSKHLLCLLDSVLDTSTIEAGEMKLTNEVFNLASLVEDVVDLHHPSAMKKGVDVVLDPCDGSIVKYAQVQGDNTKLNQILGNLLGNAVKFTNEGHITIKATAKKPSFEQSILATQHNSFLNWLSCLFYKNGDSLLETVKMVKHNPNTMEFMFEIEDTGVGIPKERQKDVFLHYVQVEETAKKVKGFGLGLGIVQSLVRLMGGEIVIVDKENGERGTLFRFNVFLTITNETTVSKDDHHNHEDIEAQDSIHQQCIGFMSLRSPSPKSSDGSSHVVLLIKSDERRRVVVKFMEGLGIRVSVTKRWENLPLILNKIKQKVHISHYSSSGKSDWSLQSERSCKSVSHNSSVGVKDVPLSSMDGTCNVLPLHKRSNNTRCVQNFILIVIDTNSGPLPEMCKGMSEIKNSIDNASVGSFRYRVVWLDNRPVSDCETSKGGERSDDKDKFSYSPNDYVMSKPLHGSRLYQVTKFLPEFGGLIPPKQHLKKSVSSEAASSSNQTHQLHARTRSRTPPTSHGGEIQEYANSASSGKENTREKKVLDGKYVLVVEDNVVMRRYAVQALSTLGATVEICENGKDALDLVSTNLRQQKNQGDFEDSITLPYDYIFMDCEMPVMDGYESTRLIRKEERKYGIPIIALTAESDSTGKLARKSIQAGMDFHLIKPLKVKDLLEVIYKLNQSIEVRN